MIIDWIPATLYGFLIFGLSHQSQTVSPGGIPDFAAHFLEYACFALTLLWGATARFRHSLSWKGMMGLWILAALYGLLDEAHQAFVPGRQASWRDAGADAVGALTCLLLAYLAGGGQWRER